SARSHRPSLASRTPARSRWSSAKCEPRRRLNVSRATEYRFHSASSVLRSRPVIVRHSSRIARSRSPAAFPCAEFLAGDLLGTVFITAGLLRLRGPVGMLANGAEPRGESVDVTQNGRGGQPLFQGGRGRADLAGVTGARLEPPLQQIYFGAQILVAAAEMCVRGLGVARLPGSDHPLTSGGDQPDGAVGVHPPEPMRITARRRGMPRACRGACRP